jgi:CIC family chloride channel protein
VAERGADEVEVNTGAVGAAGSAEMPPAPPLPRSPWWRFAIAIVTTSVIAAGFAILFRAGLSGVLRLVGSTDVVAMMAAAPWWVRLALPAIGGLVVGAIGLLAARYRGAGGLSRVMETVVTGKARIGLRRSALQSLASWVAISTGNSLGREGALIQFGAAAGEAARRVLRLDDARARVAIAAGAAAGFAAAYNTPFAAALFVLEVVTGVIVVETVVPVLFAAMLSTILTRAVIGEGPIYGAHAFTLTAPIELVAYVGLGIIAALVGVGVLRALELAERAWDRVPVPWRSAAGGAVTGAILIAVPAVAGNGYEPLGAVLDGRLALVAITWVLLAKPAATVASVGSGNPGGVFTPTLLVGGCLGTLYAAGLHAVLGNDAIGPAGGYALVGVAAALAATIHAPLTAAVLAFELSGDYAIVLPLLAATATAAGIAKRLHTDSVYTAELRRRGIMWTLTLDGRRTFEAPPAAKPPTDS